MNNMKILLILMSFLFISSTSGSNIVNENNKTNKVHIEKVQNAKCKELENILIQTDSIVKSIKKLQLDIIDLENQNNNKLKELHYLTNNIYKQTL